MTYLIPADITIQLLHESCIEDDNGCIVWQKSTNKGYAQVRIAGASRKLHRVVAYLAHGEPIDKTHALHSCDNRACLNPNHLRWGTNLENIQDRMERNRSTSGERSATAKLTWAQVEQIRQDYADGQTLRSLATRYGVTLGNVHSIITGNSWKVSGFIPIRRKPGPKA